ncbi:MAG: hypothetical protein IKF99_09520 [Oscillospiraceae bacterium]|nr:hypothetical protein [Oscillospiraceae bacterium]
MAGFIQCNYGGGGGGPVEVITGTMTGASGSTSAGQITVSSQQGKAPKRLQFWNASNLSSNMCGIDWNSDYPTSSMARYGANTVAKRDVGVAANFYYPTVVSVGSTSVTLCCSTGVGYYTGTWKYAVEFE